MAETRFWSWGIGGLIGAAIGAGSMYFSQQQSAISENQLYMEMDRLRGAIFFNEDLSPEDRRDRIAELFASHEDGFREKFIDRSQSNLTELSERIALIEAEETEEQQEAVRQQQVQQLAEEAQERKVIEAVTNPITYSECFGGPRAFVRDRDSLNVRYECP